jgi:hypothetical protein
MVRRLWELLRTWDEGNQRIQDLARIRKEREQRFRPAEATHGLWHEMGGKYRPGTCGLAFAYCWVAVMDARDAVHDLRLMSFHSIDDDIALASAVDSVVLLGTRLDAIENALLRASDSAVVRHYLRHELPMNELLFNTNIAHIYADGLSTQRNLELEFHSRSGPDGEWFKRVLNERRQVLDLLSTANSGLVEIKQRAHWMLAQQKDPHINDVLNEPALQSAQEEIRIATAQIAALAAGVDEVYVPAPQG